MVNIMIKNCDIYKDFHKKYYKSNNISYKKKLKIFEGLWAEAVSLKVFPGEDPLEGIESDIKIARILNLGRKK